MRSVWVSSSSAREVRYKRDDEQHDENPKKNSRAFHGNTCNTAKTDSSGNERHDKEDDSVMQQISHSRFSD